jgi:hypothetical protein
MAERLSVQARRPGCDRSDAGADFRQAADDSGAGRGRPGLKDVLWRIARAGEGMETAERALGWPARVGRVVVMLAPDRLADFHRPT